MQCFVYFIFPMKQRESVSRVSILVNAGVINVPDCTTSAEARRVMCFECIMRLTLLGRLALGDRESSYHDSIQDATRKIA